MKQYHIVCCCDSNYLQHVAVLLSSLYSSNSLLENVCVHVVTMGVCEKNFLKLVKQIEKYDWEIEQCPVDDIYERLGVTVPKTISIASYIRLFLPSLLDISIDKVLYLDCDIIVNDSIKDFLETDLKYAHIAGSLDIATKYSASKIDLGTEPYFNAGVLLINLKTWRAENLQDKFVKYLQEHNGIVFHHDQGLINRICKGRKIIVSPRWNVLTAYFDFPYSYLADGCNVTYSIDEIEMAKRNPAIIHFTPSMSNRPWAENCNHPYKDLYLEYLQNTEWRETPLQKDGRKARLKLLSFIYRNMPLSVYDTILKLRKMIFKNRI